MKPMPQTFPAFFQTATDKSPYDYQYRLACGEGAPAEVTGTPCQSLLIDIPTGLGKTAAVVLAWLWNRIALPYQNSNPPSAMREPLAPWPRRLAYCLPMRTLVEQTRAAAETWLKNLGLSESVGLHILMGGEDAGDWDLHPEKDAILIGTQDMLLSRALNRGYGMSRARWPMHFGLLNNDALWIMDETQLMGAGLWTSAQLDWLRQKRFKPVKNCVTWWMSATVGAAFLETKDRKDAQLPAPAKIEITDTEAAHLDILNAVRPVSNWQPAKQKDRQKRDTFVAALASDIFAGHTQHTLSLVVCNTVAAAQEIFAKLTTANTANIEIILLTSRFRSADRKAHLDKLLAFEAARKIAVTNGEAAPAHNGLICVSTQVVEAGADISARRLWTELAPWPSTLQRLGRLNRDGKLNAEAAAYVFEIPSDKSDKNAASPYEPADLKTAKKILDALVTKSAAKPVKPIREILTELSSPSSGVHADIAKSLEPKPTPFPRAFDVHGLFSTEPDVFGGFTDVSPWVRGGDKNADVIVFWRDWDVEKKSPNASEFNGSAFQRDEGCAVAAYRVRDFVKNAGNAFIWNDRAEKWESIKPGDICPGMIVMLPAHSGGYDANTGWTGDKANRPANTPPPGPFDAEGKDDDKQTTTKHQWVALAAHLAAVAAEVETIADALALPCAQKNALVHAAALHDIGKSFPQWQDTLPTPRPDGTTIWAKAPSFAKRAGMRHEAASALAALRRYYRERAADFPALTIYLIAAHHGLVRTVLNSRPAPAIQPNVAGIPVTVPPPKLPFNDWQLDFSPATDGGDGEFSETANGELVFTPTTPGWTALVADLLGGWEDDAPKATAGAVPANGDNEPHSLNPFHLAFLETLLRAADCRVSASETGISSTEDTQQ